MLMYQVDCGPASGDFTLYHSGDGCNLAKMMPDRPVDLFILHIAVGMTPADAITHIQPRLTLASHMLELGHSTKPPHPWRWSFDYAYGTIDYLPPVPSHHPHLGREVPHRRHGDPSHAHGSALT